MGEGALQGQVAIVTGAGSGLGAAFARRLAADGALVVVNDLVPGAAARVADEVGGVPMVFDVTDAAAVDAAVDAVATEHGRIDICVNNAGIAPPFERARFDRLVGNEMLRMAGRIGEMEPLDVLVTMTDQEWDRMIRVHLYGVFHGTRAVLRHMQPARRGAIVNMSSVLGLRPSGGAPHYSVAKAAIIALTRATAEEVAHLGIRINAVCPGWVDTPLLAPYDDDIKQMLTTRIPMGRMATPEELAELVRFLCGPESSYSTGEIHGATGGFG